jgi:hypothetical protein
MPRLCQELGFWIGEGDREQRNKKVKHLRNRVEKMDLGMKIKMLSIRQKYHIFIEYSAYVFTLKMILKYSLRTIHGR